MQPKEKQEDGNDPFDAIDELVNEVNSLADAQNFFCRTPLFRTGTDGLHILCAMNAFLGMKSAELGKLIDRRIGPPPEWN